MDEPGVQDRLGLACAMMERMTDTPFDPSCQRLRAQALSAEAMAPYGWVLDNAQAFDHDAGQVINAGTSRRADLPGELALNADGGKPLVCVFRASGQALTGPWRMLERHRLGTQTFVPLGAAPATGSVQAVCVLLVALGDARPDEHSLRAFWVRAGQAFTLKAGTWHHPLIATHDRDFLVVERKASTMDCEVMALQRPVEIVALD